MGSWLVVLAIGMAGALGAAARFGIAEWMARRWGGPFPLPTFVINVTGAFVLGFILTASLSALPTTAATSLRAILGTGFMGGYTTFSTLSYETHRLTRRGDTALAWLNALGTLAAGILAVGLGIAIGQHL